MVAQHSQLVHAVDTLIVRTRTLWRICALLAIALAAVALAALLR